MTERKVVRLEFEEVDLTSLRDGSFSTSNHILAALAAAGLDPDKSFIVQPKFDPEKNVTYFEFSQEHHDESVEHQNIFDQ